MQLGRVLAPKQVIAFRLYAPNVSFARSASHVATTGGDTAVSVKEDKPNYFKRILLRLKGIPLKGEENPPTPFWFRDCDRLFHDPSILEPMPKDFKEHPDRDLKNFPYPEKHMYPPKSRLLIVPDCWCTPIEKITGTSGPYVLIGGLFAFVLNKEWLTVDENMMKVQSLLLMYFVISRTFNFRFDKFMYGGQKETVDRLKGIIDDELKDAREFRKASSAESASLKEVSEKFPVIFKENLALQLEETYRRNVEAVTNELKRRLDYLQEVEETKMRFEREVLLKSIIQGVQSQIQNNEGNIKDAYLDNCISQLKTLHV
jgi:F-type H+-transporting ATPase subunit b